MKFESLHELSEAKRKDLEMLKEIENLLNQVGRNSLLDKLGIIKRRIREYYAIQHQPHGFACMSCANQIGCQVGLFNKCASYKAARNITFNPRGG